MLKWSLFLTANPHSRGFVVYQTSRRSSWVVEALHLFKYVLPLATFGGAPYSCDEASVVKCVFKPGCSVGTRMYIADKMSVDLCHVDRRIHEPTGDRGLFRRCEWDVGRQLEVPCLETLRVTTGQAKPSLRSPDFEGEASILLSNAEQT